eukprot:6554729-Lingulodinium_polyedra.AAC.1
MVMWYHCGGFAYLGIRCFAGCHGCARGIEPPASAVYYIASGMFLLARSNVGTYGTLDTPAWLCWVLRDYDMEL